MGFQKMVKHMQEGQSVRLVLALLVLSEGGGAYFWQMLVLGDCQNLFLVQAA
jgi:hypothetical protein